MASSFHFNLPPTLPHPLGNDVFGEFIANPLHATIAAKGLSPMRLPYAAANAGPAATSGFSDGQPKPKVRHLNMQKAAQGSASYLLAFIGIGGPRWLSLCPIPIPDGGVRRIQITASPASHDFTPLPAVKPFPPIPGGPQSGGNRVTILPMRTQCNSVTRSASVARSCTESTAR
ncbi:hypothetical protein EDB86DRAFT_3075272 [Lactarius hatsudake]|nr:hypothetical protein EDB86DRAFT_3075272 [Lactarius hatsudake]